MLVGKVGSDPRHSLPDCPYVVFALGCSGSVGVFGFCIFLLSYSLCLANDFHLQPQQMFCSSDFALFFVSSFLSHSHCVYLFSCLFVFFFFSSFSIRLPLMVQTVRKHNSRFVPPNLYFQTSCLMIVETCSQEYGC